MNAVFGLEVNSLRKQVKDFACCLPLTKSFRKKIRLESKWNSTFFGSFQRKISRSNGTAENWVCPVFADGIFQREICVPFLQSHLWY